MVRTIGMPIEQTIHSKVVLLEVTNNVVYAD